MKQIKQIFGLFTYLIKYSKIVRREKKICKKLLFYGVSLDKIFTLSGFYYLCKDILFSRYDEIALNHNINRIFPKNLIKKKGIYSGTDLDIVWSHADQNYDARSKIKLNDLKANKEYLNVLENIYHDLKNVLDDLKEYGMFPDSKSLTKGNEWKWLTLEKVSKDNKKIRDVFNSLDLNTDFGMYPFLSKLKAGTNISRHSGSTTFRHRIHMGVYIPEPNDSYIIVDDIKYFWEEGKAFIFDDSLPHEVKHEGKLDRIVLIVDIWPRLIDLETKKFIKSNIFWMKQLCVLEN